ncbi:MAG: hypothetical protein C4586_06165 [Anaerolineaceae bacterium]|nr:MAG: hypothetical protein C4586_06165 [Anaerolineaceae bacterium]
MPPDVLPRAEHDLPVDILTAGYRVVGRIMVTTQGVIGMLNYSTHSALEVNDARLARREDLSPQALVRVDFAKLVEYPEGITTQTL